MNVTVKSVFDIFAARDRAKALIERCSIGGTSPAEVMVEVSDLKDLIDFATSTLTAQAATVMLRQNIDLDKEVDRMREINTLYAKQRTEAEAQVAELGKACDLFKDKILELERTVDRANLERKRLEAERDLAQAMHTEASSQRDDCAQQLTEGRRLTEKLIAERRALVDGLEAVAHRAIMDVVEGERKAVSKGSGPYSDTFRAVTLINEVGRALRDLAGLNPDL